MTPDHTGHRNDVVVTGLPRAGTTLSMELLNRAPDTVALDEPMDGTAWNGPKARGPRILRRRPSSFDEGWFVEKVTGFFAETRASLLEGRGAVSTNVDGQVLGAKFADDKTETGLRRRITQRTVIEVDKPLSQDFTLAVKHNAGFTAALPLLISTYKTFAIVRNPLSTLASWQTVPVPIQQGRVHRAEQVDAKLRSTLDATTDVLDRQFILLEWFFAHYTGLLPREAVIRYEDVIASRGSALSAISAPASALDEPIESRNTASLYDDALMRRMADRLLTNEGSWRTFYSDDDIRSVVKV